MKNNIEHDDEEEYNFVRYPKTDNKSLKPWNAADEHILRCFDSLEDEPESVAIFNDRFGFLTTNFIEESPKVCINFASQHKAIIQNLEVNKLSVNDVQFIKPLEQLSLKVDAAIIKIPKSIDLFRLQLMQIANSLDENGIVICGFMTRHFTKQFVSIAEEFFENVEQSLAWKKSRVLILKKVKEITNQNIINSIPFEHHTFQQYFGVFSAKHIDDASQFLVKCWKIDEDAKRVLDLASGNGFVAKMMRLRNKEGDIHLIDDDWLAVESSKLNFDREDENTFFHFEDSLDSFEDNFFDLIISNPPFHFEYETNIEVTINLFNQVKRCLKKTGSFQLVANRHLNYRRHLNKLFADVRLLRRNKKFEVFNCLKPLD